jgi:hypothetical protein
MLGARTRGHDDTETARDRRELYLRQRERRHMDQQLPRYDTKLWMRDLMEGAAYLPK